MRHRIVITEPLHPDALAWLRERCEVVEVKFEDAAALAEALQTADGLVVRTYTQVNEELVTQAPRLKVVGRAGVGLDNVDVEACRGRGVQVVSTPEANTTAVVEYVFAQVFAVVRPLTPLTGALPASQWRALRDSSITPRELSEMTLGILGLGRIGKAVARVGETLFGRVIYHDLVEIPERERLGAAPVSREELLRESDVLTIHVDGRASNRNLIDSTVCALLRPDVIFINASRGFVVDAATLALFLKANPKATAMLDVHEPEPIRADYPLLGLPNAKLFPHIGAATARAKANMSWVVKDVWAALEGSEP